MYGSASVQWTCEAGGRCVTADYAQHRARVCSVSQCTMRKLSQIHPNSRVADVVSVTNTVRVLGFPVKVNGYAIANPKHAGELDVSLGPGKSPSKAGSFNNENYRAWPSCGRPV